MKIGLIIISTGSYHHFIEPLLHSARTHFMPGENVTFYLFTDSLIDRGEDVVIIPTKHEPWPGPTLHRYRNIINSKSLLNGSDYLFYIDADSLFVDTVGREILKEGLTGVLHPGFAMFPGNGSWGNKATSMSYTPIHNRKNYYCGGFQFGSTSAFLSACCLMRTNIEIDEKNGVIPEHNDETVWNSLLSAAPHNILPPSYMMVEEPAKRKLWKIDHFEPKIIALAKDHKEVRK